MIDLWFAVIAFLWTGYFVLEGFDFGVGLLAPFISTNEREHQQALTTIGPVWDGNEVWLITAVGAMFAAFPAWYAGMFSGYYLPVVLILVGLIVRGLGLEWRSKLDSPRLADLGVVIGSALPAFLWGAIFADLLALNPIVGGLFSLTLSVLHGAVFLALKTTGAVRLRARRVALAVAAVVIPLGVVALSALGTAPALVAMGALAAATVLIWRHREGWAFTATAASIAAVAVAVFWTLRTAPLPGLTLAEAASGPYTMQVLTWIGLIALPFVLLYQGWTYWVFRKRVAVS